MALTVHLEHNRKPLSMLDVIKVPKGHSGANLAIAFADVLQTFRIEEKA